MHVRPPPPTWEKSSAQKCSKKERKFRPDMSAKKNVHVPIRYDKIIFDKLRQRHSTYALGIATLELENVNVSSAIESKRIACNLPFENQLFGYYHYCTEININFLLNTCNFHRKFRFIFSLNLSENTQNVHFREAKPIGNTQYNITYLNYKKRCFFPVEKGAPSVLYRYIF